MSQQTDIEWCQNADGTRGRTWNPVRGCSKISPGCKHCYAETFAVRWRGIHGHAYEQGFDLRLVPEKLDEPLRRRKPTTYFVNSMSDLFHEQVPFEYVAAVFGVMAASPQHTFQVLTKRAERMHDFFAWLAASGPSAHVFGSNRGARWYAWNRDVEHERVFPRSLSYSEPKQWPWPLPNVWLGVSVENRKHGLPRIDELRATPAAVRFLSIEPLLEDLGTIDLTGIDWVIVGGESGPGARWMDPQWARGVVEQCRAARVPVFVKQMGIGYGKQHKDMAQFPEDLRVRQMPARR